MEESPARVAIDDHMEARLQVATYSKTIVSFSSTK